MLDAAAKAIMIDMTDECFCETLIDLLGRQMPDEEPATRLLWEPWVLQKLYQIRQRALPLYFGVFLGPLRRRYPGLALPSELLEAMLDATAAGVDGLSGDVADETFLAAAEDIFQHGLPRGAHPGWPSLADHYTVRRGEVTVVTGVASHMKSTWLQNLCVNLARDDQRFGIFSPEHYPLGLLSTLLLQQYTGLALHSAAFHQPGEFRRGMQWVTERFHAIQPPDETQPTVSWLLAVARLQVERYGITGLVLDPWNTIDHVFGAQSETQYISSSLEKIRRFARSQNVHVWIVAHPTKMHKAVSGDYAGKYPPPTPYDIGGSAHWYNKADNCLCVWRDVEEDTGKVEVHVQKVRNRAVGKAGAIVELQYDGLRFQEVTPAYAVPQMNGRRYGND